MLCTTILIVDDHPIFAKGLSQLLSAQNNYKIVGSAVNSAEALALLQEKNPMLAIVDLNLGDENGLDLIKEMRTLQKKLKILVLSMHDERYYAERALHLGARGYIMKEEAINNVFEAIKTILEGKIWLSPDERERLFEYMISCDSKHTSDGRFASIKGLSNRQLQIFSMIGEGVGTVEIAARLNISPKTVDTHKENIKLKLHCNSSQDLRQQAIAWTKT